MKITADNPNHLNLKVTLDGHTPNFIIEADDEAGYVLCHKARLTRFGNAVPTEETIMYRGEVRILAPLMVPVSEHPQREFFEGK